MYDVGKESSFLLFFLHLSSPSPVRLSIRTLTTSTQIINKIKKMKLLSITAALLSLSSALGFAPASMGSSSRVATSMNAAAEELYIDQDRRNIMNLILVGSAGVTIAGLGVPYVLFFLPPGSGGGGGGVPAKNALGDDLYAQAYLESKLAKDRSLAQGLKGDAT
jgi:cytochrome b6-f complex iron-sulfur subunit